MLSWQTHWNHPAIHTVKYLLREGGEAEAEEEKGTSERFSSLHFRQQ